MTEHALTILIVDDDDVDRERVRRLLWDDYTLNEASTGEQARALLQSAPPDCILLDYQLPGTDTMALISECSVVPIPIVMLTGVGSEAVAVEAMKRGALGYLSKMTLTRESVIHAVTNAIEKVSLQRQLHVKEEALRESEARYRTLVEGSLQGLYIHQDALIQFANPAMAAIFGYGGPQDLVHLPYWTLVAPHERVRLEDYRTAHLKGETVPTQYEYQGVREDGTSLWLECVVSQVPWNGKPALLIALVDVTLRKHAEEELLRAQKLESVGVLAAGIAHDFNNLLTGIVGNVSLAKMLAGSNVRVMARLLEAENACQRATALTHQLLTFAKGGAPVRHPIAIMNFLTESVVFAVHGSNVRADFAIAEDLWLVDGDEAQMYQVIYNVVLNAVQAMPQGGSILVQAENVWLSAGDVPQLQEGRYVKIAVHDHGCGIPQDVLPKIFDPYFTTKETGSGLGLAAAYAIVTKHDGCMTVASTVKTGTTVFIYLPASQHDLPFSRAIPDTPLVGNARILVMDDEEIIRDLLCETLTSWEYEVVCACDGVEAIALYQDALASGQPFRVVILDMTVPGAMGGKEAMAYLRAIDPHVKALISSGYANDPVMANFAEYGFSGVVTKPYTLQRLQDVLLSVL